MYSRRELLGYFMNHIPSSISIVISNESTFVQLCIYNHIAIPIHLHLINYKTHFILNYKKNLLAGLEQDLIMASFLCQMGVGGEWGGGAWTHSQPSSGLYMYIKQFKKPT
jgi:hypothetical protein